MPYDDEIAGRMRRLLGPDRAVVEKKMMGGLVFMVDGHMCCGLHRGYLMVRVGPAVTQRALALPHTRPMDIGGRSPAGFIYVDAEGFATETALSRWITLGLDFVATLPAKPARPVAARRRRSRVSG